MNGLLSLRALDQAQEQSIWPAVGATDMRCGFDRLAERVRAVIGQDPLSGHLFQCPSDCARPEQGNPSHTDHASFPPAERQAI